MIRRRDFVKAGAAMAALGGLPGRAARPTFPCTSGRATTSARDRASPIVSTRARSGSTRTRAGSPSGPPPPRAEPVRNFGLGLVGLHVGRERSGARGARRGSESLEAAIEKLAACPFVDVLYIRCDWRDVQSRPADSTCSPVWKLTLDAAKRHGLRVGFRVQLSNPEFQPARLALPDFLQAKVPLVTIGGRVAGSPDRVEPRYDHPEFQQAFRELNELLAAEFDGNPLVEFMDLMMYGFWGEGHTSDYPSPFPDYLTAERTFVEMTRLPDGGLEAGAPRGEHAARHQRVGQPRGPGPRGAGRLLAALGQHHPGRADADRGLANRPPWLAVIMEDGYHRHYRTDAPALHRRRRGRRTSIDRAMLHTLDLGGNYWSLWTEADNLRATTRAPPDAFDALRRRHRLPCAALVGLAAQALRHGRAGRRLRERRRRRSAGRAPRLRGDPRRQGAGGRGPGRGPPVRRPSAARVVRPAPGPRRPARSCSRPELETNGVRRPVRWACAQPLNAGRRPRVRLKRHDDADWRKGV